MQEEQKKVQFESNKPEVLAYDNDPRVSLRKGTVKAYADKAVLTVPPR